MHQLAYCSLLASFLPPFLPSRLLASSLPSYLASPLFLPPPSSPPVNVIQSGVRGGSNIGSRIYGIGGLQKRNFTPNPLKLHFLPFDFYIFFMTVIQYRIGNLLLHFYLNETIMYIYTYVNIYPHIPL